MPQTFCAGVAWLISWSMMGPNSSGCQRAPLSMVASVRQPSHMEILPPCDSNNLPVMCDDSGLPNHTTKGATLSGAQASKLPSAGALTTSGMALSVMAVRAAGAKPLTVNNCNVASIYIGVVNAREVEGATVTRFKRVDRYSVGLNATNFDSRV